jgi:hypothetical protein
MIPTPADRALAQVFVTTMEDTTLEEPRTALATVHPDALWELAFLLIAVARRTGWAPAAEKPLTT